MLAQHLFNYRIDNIDYVNRDDFKERGATWSRQRAILVGVVCLFALGLYFMKQPALCHLQRLVLGTEVNAAAARDTSRPRESSFSI